jgi:hypothetical protein
LLQSGCIPFCGWHFDWDGNDAGQKASIEGTKECGRFTVREYLKMYFFLEQFGCFGDTNQCDPIAGNAELKAFFAPGWAGDGHLAIEKGKCNFAGTAQQFA